MAGPAFWLFRGQTRFFAAFSVVFGAFFGVPWMVALRLLEQWPSNRITFIVIPAKAGIERFKYPTLISVLVTEIITSRQMFELHPQLAKDTFPLGCFTLCQLLLMNDANYPW
ncbi:MAG: hypothetical protein ACREFD_14885, partial [Stellaceae bacterium]